MPLIPPVPIYLGLVPIVWDFCVVMLALGHCGIHTGGQNSSPAIASFYPIVVSFAISAWPMAPPG